MYCACIALLSAGLLTAAPVEFAGESTTINLQPGRSLVLRPKVDVHRTAIAAEGIVQLVQLTPREIMLIGHREGKTTATFWFADPAMPPVTYVIDVAAGPSPPK
jgi:Flp pilus assembly secretin CpaC